MGTTEPDRERSMSDATDTSTTTDAAAAADTSTTATTDAAATDTGTGRDWQAEADKWKALSRKHEDSAKTNADKAKRLDELEEANATEIEKAAKAAAKAQADATAAQAELAVVRAAVKHGVSEDDLADFSEAVGSHGTAEELAARAEKLAPRFKTEPAKTRTDFGAGDRGDDITGGADTLDGQIAEAQKAGNLQLTIALKQKRSAQLLEKKS